MDREPDRDAFTTADVTYLAVVRAVLIARGTVHRIERDLARKCLPQAHSDCVIRTAIPDRDVVFELRPERHRVCRVRDGDRNVRARRDVEQNCVIRAERRVHQTCKPDAESSSSRRDSQDEPRRHQCQERCRLRDAPSQSPLPFHPGLPPLSSHLAGQTGWRNGIFRPDS